MFFCREIVFFCIRLDDYFGIVFGDFHQVRISLFLLVKNKFDKGRKKRGENFHMFDIKIVLFSMVHVRSSLERLSFD